MNTQKKGSYKGLITFIIIIVALILIFYLSFSNTSGTEIKINDFVGMLERNEISEVYIVGYTSGGTVKVRLRKDSRVNDRSWPANSDCYFTYISYDEVALYLKGYNQTILDAQTAMTADDFESKPEEEQAAITELAARKLVTKIMGNPSTPFIERALPYLSIIVLIIIAFVVIRSITVRNSSSSSFGRSKARVTRSNIKFADIAGADEEKEEIQEIVEFLKNPLKFKALGARIPKGILLVGNPGTGKTLLAKAVAGESNVPFFSISGSDFVELYVGVGASRVRDLFETAKRNAPCIVFIDEIDAVGRQRGTGVGGGSDEREQTLNQLLVEMDGFDGFEGVIVLAATNRADVLDPALLRPGRFDRQIYVNVPDVRGREGIIKIHAKGKPIDPDVDFKDIARFTSGFTGADIENFLNEAALIAARNGKVSISKEDIFEGINKVLMGPQKKSRLITENDKKITAYHESGHAIVTKILGGGEEVHEVSIIPRGMAMGYTATRPADDDEGMTYSRLTKKLSTLMGGRVAEEIIFKDITAGASADISNATNIAKRMVTEWGMSKTLGFVNLGANKEVFIGRDYQVQNNYSEVTAAKIDEEIKSLLDAAYKVTTKILKEHLDILHNMANLLLEKETIYTDEIDAIMSGQDYKEVSRMIDEKDRQRKEEQEAKRKEQEAAARAEMQKLKEQAAQALASAGVLSDMEYEMIKKDGENLQANTPKQEEPATKAKPSPTTKPAARKPRQTTTAAAKAAPKKTTKTSSAKPKTTSTASKTKTSKDNKQDKE